MELGIYDTIKKGGVANFWRGSDQLDILSCQLIASFGDASWQRSTKKAQLPAISSSFGGLVKHALGVDTYVNIHVLLR